MTNEEYKKLSIKEFTRAAKNYESDHAGIYEMCKKDYPDRHYTGLDLTPAMIEQAKKKNIPNAVFVVGDCERKER